MGQGKLHLHNVTVSGGEWDHGGPGRVVHPRAGPEGCRRLRLGPADQESACRGDPGFQRDRFGGDDDGGVTDGVDKSADGAEAWIGWIQGKAEEAAELDLQSAKSELNTFLNGYQGPIDKSDELLTEDDPTSI